MFWTACIVIPHFPARLFTAKDQTLTRGNGLLPSDLNCSNKTVASFSVYWCPQKKTSHKTKSKRYSGMKVINTPCGGVPPMQKIPTPENPEVSHIFSFEPGVGQITQTLKYSFMCFPCYSSRQP